MNQNSQAIVILCSHLCVREGIKPLTPGEWSKLAQYLREQELEPGELLEYSLEDFKSKLQCTPEGAERVQRLIDRSASLWFEVDRYNSMGIELVTRADKGYPKQLKQKLKNTCPPIFYYAGELELLEYPYAGYAGSRAVEEEDVAFTRQTVSKTLSWGYGVVSGGAKGVDSTAEMAALQEGGRVVSYLADSLMRRIKNKVMLQAIHDKRAILLSAMNPDAGFRAGTAMARNRLIYSQSSGTVIIRSDLKKGGTWAGATDSIKHEWSPVYCWDREEYPGNRALIAQGAIGIDSSWDGNIGAARPCQEEEDPPEQLNFFTQST